MDNLFKEMVKGAIHYSQTKNMDLFAPLFCANPSLTTIGVVLFYFLIIDQTILDVSKKDSALFKLISDCKFKTALIIFCN